MIERQPKRTKTSAFFDENAYLEIPSSPADRKKIKDAMTEISMSMTRIEAERDLIKTAVKDICKTYNLPPRAFRKLVSVYHRQSINEEMASFEEFETLYESLMS